MASRLGRSFTIVRSLFYSTAFVWIWTEIAMTVRAFDARVPVSLPVWMRAVGFGVAVAGATLAAACIASFVTVGRGTPAPFDPPREFVASGPYRYVRNPMYLGAAAVILGAGLILSSPSILLLALVFLVTMHLLVILYEEPTLANKFGTSYPRYRSFVHRWRFQKPKIL